MPSLVSFVLVILFSLFQSLSSAQNWSNHYSSALTASQIQEKQDNYHSGLKKLEIYRQNQFRLYQQASSAEKSRIIEGSLQELERYLVEEIFPAWSGTPWDFNGISQTPGEGEIACGYFVSSWHSNLHSESLKPSCRNQSGRFSTAACRWRKFATILRKAAVESIS